jgi:hypothetical protein
MLRKLTLGLVAATSLSATALAPTAASAMPWGGGWGHHHHHHFGPGPGFGIGFVGYRDDGCYVLRRVLPPCAIACARSTSANIDRSQCSIRNSRTPNAAGNFLFLP